MKYLKINKYLIALTVSVLTSVLLAIAATVYAQNALPNTFSPGTTISSSQVNENFTTLSQSMPGMKTALSSGSVTLSTEWQNVLSLTVTPPMNGVLLLLGTASVTVTQGSTAGGSSWNYSSATFCMTPASGGGSPCNGARVTLDTVPSELVHPYAPRLTVPATMIGSVGVVKNTPVTYYLTAAKASESVGSIVIDTSSLNAIFLPAGYMH